jgi:hypothetical protein
MDMCSACSRIDQSRQSAPAHARLLLGTTQALKPDGKRSVRIAMFQCAACLTRWRYETGPGYMQAGWTRIGDQLSSAQNESSSLPIGTPPDRAAPKNPSSLRAV